MTNIQVWGGKTKEINRSILPTGIMIIRSSGTDGKLPLAVLLSYMKIMSLIYRQVLMTPNNTGIS